MRRANWDLLACKSSGRSNRGADWYLFMVVFQSTLSVSGVSSFITGIRYPQFRSMAWQYLLVFPARI
jgi:hypothetical protein